MKKKLFFITALSLFIICTISTYAVSNSLSPALEVIANDTQMIKCAGMSEVVKFSEDDFMVFADFDHSTITIAALPPESEGELLLGTSAVRIGQTISMSNLDLLRFIPRDGVVESSFKFSLDRSYTTECIIKLTKSAGVAPTATGIGMNAITQTDVTYHGVLEGNDADGDVLLFEVVEYPSNGILTLTDCKTGSFTYTPFDGFEGIDKFVYRVRDEMGHFSDKCEASLTVEPRAYSKVITDMEDHPSYNAVLAMVGGGYMDVISEKGKLYFDPDEHISREDFLVTVMKALGADSLSPVNTIFLDNEDISKENRGYVAAAYKFGIIKGDNWEGVGKNFYPDRMITRAEAAVILNRILGIEAEGSVQVSTDNDMVPTWAAGDITALTSIGIISFTDGAYNAEGFITRCEVADMLYCTKNIFME